MLIAIISDIHDNLVNLNKCLSWCKKEKIKNLICCGDITNSETLKILSENFDGQIYLVRGNLEIYEEEEVFQYKNIKYLGRYGRFEFDNKIIGVCHEPYFIKKVLEDGICDIIFYGHMHEPWQSKENDVLIINPGTLGGVFQKATFAVWDIKEKEPELKILEELNL
jgi:putative phosphoesterase